MGLTAKQTAFVREYLVDLNATQAAVRAGYSAKTAEKIGSENLRKPEVAKAIQAAMDKRAERVEVTADTVLRELLRIATVDIGEAFTEDGALKPLAEMPKDVRRAIASVEVEEEWDDADEDDEDAEPGARVVVGRVSKVKFWDKPKALELLGRHLKLFTDKVEHSGSVAITVLDPYAKPPEFTDG